LSCEISEILGTNQVETIKILDKKTGKTIEKSVSGVFIAVGMNPNSELVKDIVKLDDRGYIVADDSCRSSEKGIYAIGDIRTKKLRQVVTAVSDGAVAIASLEEDMIHE
ncbi:MAG: NAD(P)/FAD-dependent oxidoreductase, partial [Wujia sp.]